MLGAPKINARRTYVQIPCPLAPQTHANGTDRHPSLSILISDMERSGWKCHACGEKGALPILVTKWATISRQDPGPLYDLIKKEEEGLEARQNRVDNRLVGGKWGNKSLVVDNVDWETYSDAEMEAFQKSVPQWVIDRGASLETCKAWGLREDPAWADPETGEKWTRVVIPVRRADGKLVGIMGRAIDSACPDKYWSYVHFVKTNHLFGLDRIEKRDSVIVVEGMFDVLRLWGYGLPVVGIIGSEPSERQAQMLLGFKRVLLALDRDSAGEKGNRRLTGRLLNRVPLFAVPFPDGKTDPKQFTKEEAERAVANAKRIL